MATLITAQRTYTVKLSHDDVILIGAFLSGTTGRAGCALFDLCVGLAPDEIEAGARAIRTCIDEGRSVDTDVVLLVATD